MPQPAIFGDPSSIIVRAILIARRLSELLGDGPFFAGGVFTRADAAVAPLSDYLMALPEAEALIPPTSPLRCWWQRSRPRNGFLRNAAPERVRRTSKP
jgi:glutathione S-transferase